MGNIDMVNRLGFIIEKLNKAGDYSIANELSEIQINLTEERSKEWNAGFNVGYGLALRNNTIRERIAKL
jgi:hypothetical protein